jgi:ubiquitin-conjugating enzyme E2 O
MFRPGDHVLWKNEDGARYAVVRSVNPVARTAIVRVEGANAEELVSVLELDHSGTSEPGQDPTTAFDGFGVRRGDFVFIHKEGTTNGCAKPRVPRIGELEPWVRETPFDEGLYSGWRKEMNEIGNKLAMDDRAGIIEPYVSRPAPGDTSLHWIGEVTEVWDLAC